MKHLIVILLLLTVVQGFGQKKKKTDPKDEQIDTLTKTNSALSRQLDSVTRKYDGVYATIKDKVLLNDFDPNRLPEIIDSIRASRDSAAFLLSAPLRDSITLMSKKNDELRTQLDSVDATIKRHNTEAADKTKLMAELKDLKSLLDNKIITQAEFDSKKKLIMEKWK